MRSPVLTRNILPRNPHSDTRHRHNIPNTDQDRVSFEIDIPETLAQALEDDATKAGLSLDDFLCKVLSEQLKRYDEQ